MKFIPFKRFVQSRKGGGWGQDAGKDEVDVSCVRVADFEYDKLTSKKILSTIRSIPARQYKNIKLNKGDILIEKSGGGETTLVGRAISFDQEIDTICSNFIERIEIKTNKLEPKFACYILASAYSNKINASCIKQTTGIQNLDVDAYLSSVLVPDIPKEKQRRIVDFLESKIKDISDSIFKKRVCLQKFSEYRQSLITQAVTKGLDPKAEMKDSGVEWIGKIPAHWNIAAIKHCGQYTNGLTYSPQDLVADGTPVLRSTNVQNGQLDINDLVFVRSEVAVDSMLKAGDVLICSRNGSAKLIGKCAYISEEDKFAFGAFMMVFRSKLKKFGFYILNSALFSYYKPQFGTSTINQLTGKSFGEMLIPIPPDSEMTEIAIHLDNKIAQILKTENSIKNAIELLLKYRTSLISAAVTGKIDISEVNQ